MSPEKPTRLPGWQLTNGRQWVARRTCDDTDQASTVVLPMYSDFVGGHYQPDFRWVLGPAQMTGPILSNALAEVDTVTGDWEVVLDFTAEGSAELNRYAAQYYRCYQEDPSDPPDAISCPPYGAVQALEIDATVYTAASIQSPSFAGAAIISGSAADQFTAQQAGELADILKFGALPVGFRTESFSLVTPK